MSLQVTDDPGFTVTCWSATSVPRHVLEYEVLPNERVFATALPVGVSGSQESWIVSGTGLRDVGTVRSTDTRWLVTVHNEITNTWIPYEIVVASTASECRVTMAYQG